MKTKIDIPFYSQHSLDIEESWRPRCCGVVCVKMIIDFLCDQNLTPTTNELIQEGVAMGGYESRGWYSDALVRLLRNYGLVAYCQEFRSLHFDQDQKTFEEQNLDNRMLRKGIEKIISEMKWEIPVIASFTPGFNGNGSNHLVTLTGYVEDGVGIEGFYFHDPNEPSYWPHHFIEIERFRRYWRRIAIFVEK
ncbi:C39 family peptidase [Candidatus Nomurabacteria bacterium]|nr:C39 family peptidase [Candidatus Nomurabacteria bacterium]